MLNRPLYYKRDGKPYLGTIMDIVLQWGKDFQDPQLHIVKQTKLENGLFVSTVWLGLDHAFLGGRPLIFESMVFSKGGSGEELGNDLDCRRYSTEDAAMDGHEQLVRKWSS